jgi:hypothetical protein
MRHILSQTNKEQYLQLREKSEGEQRYMFYSDKLESKTFFEAVLKDEEDKIIYSERTYQLMFNKKIFPFSKQASGWSFDKRTQKLKVWPNTAFYSLGMERQEKLFTLLGKEWMEHIRWNLILNKSLLEKILQNKITNPRQACEHFIKVNRFPKHTSVKYMLDYLKNVSERHTILKVKDVFKDINHYLENHTDHGTRLDDMVKQALILNEKIDFRWSKKRMGEVHQDWTQRIMEKELTFGEDHKLLYQDIGLPSEFEVIKSQRRLFEEGTKMQHCIYTNYLTGWKNKEYIVLHCTATTGETCTVGIGHLYGKNLHGIDQIHMKHNVEPSKSTVKWIEKSLKPFMSKFSTMVGPLRKRKSALGLHRPVYAPR